MRRALAFLPLAALAVLAVLFVGWGLKRDPAYKPDALIGRAVPETVLPMLAGNVAGPGQVDLKTAGVGRPMLINVFASWCAPCRLEHPVLMELQAQGVALVGVAYKDEPGATRRFLDELGDPFVMVLVDADGRAGIDLGLAGVPETYAVDAYGTVVAKHSGPLTDPQDVRRLTEALRAPSRRP